MSLNKAEKTLATAYASQTGNDVKTISPAIIAILLQIATSLLSSCLGKVKPSNIADTVKKRPVFARLRIRQAALQSTSNRKDLDAIVESVFDAASNATPDELAQLHQENSDVHFAV